MKASVYIKDGTKVVKEFSGNPELFTKLVFTSGIEIHTVYDITFYPPYEISKIIIEK
jgi:hypothetical protein